MNYQVGILQIFQDLAGEIVGMGGRLNSIPEPALELLPRNQDNAVDPEVGQVAFAHPFAHGALTDAEGLRGLGLLKEDGAVRTFFMHGTSHYLGLNVHDVGTGGALTPGTVITVEPGIYISPSPDVDPKWWNIGVRIEDDVLVTDGDPVVMSSAAPRTVAEVEALMRETGLGNAPGGLVERAPKTKETVGY